MLLTLALLACRKDDLEPDQGVPPEPSPLLEIEQTASYAIPGMTGPAYAIRTTGSIPYLYAENRADLARVTGFVLANDRYFMIDMIRRLSEGRLSEMLGEAGLEADMEARGTGMTRVRDHLLEVVEADPEWAAVLDGYAEGISAWVAEVQANRKPVPSELATLGPALGASDPKTLLEPYTRADVIAIGATLIYNLGFETGDVGRAETDALLDGWFSGADLDDLRQAGLRPDIDDRVDPTWAVASSPGWGPSSRRRARPPVDGVPREIRVPPRMVSRLAGHLERIEARQGHDHDAGWGSNAWAVGGYASADGRALLAGDGHLPLSIPALFYSLGMDTAHLSGDPDGLTQVGLALPGFPTLAVGTNGKVAWSQTQLMGDITDWYREEIQLDASGRPAATLFEGEWKPVVAIDETYVIRDVPLMGSVGRTETWTRYQTFDGRMITEVEGRDASPDEVPGPGESLINVTGSWVVPGDTDGDDVIAGISFDYAAFDDGNLLLASYGFGTAEDVHEFREETRKLVAYSQNLVAADANGDILYTGYQAVPCREYLPRDAQGRWLPGADPNLLLDGTRYGGFTIPVGPDGVVDESQGADPYRCVVPFEEYPQSLSPAQGYVLTANNDIGGLTFDNDLVNEPWYVGGPWLEGYRAKRIDEVLAAEVAAGTADLASMAKLQGDHHSVVAEHWLQTLLDAIADGRAAAASAPNADPLVQRLADLYTADAARMDEVDQRLSAWRDAGMDARAGVETSYLSLEPGDEDHAVATMIWNAWIGAFMSACFDDEAFPGVFHPTGDTGRTRTLKRILDGRGPGNPMGLASFNPATQESAYFDDRNTPELETSTALMLSSLTSSLDVLAGPETADGEGGFGTDEMSEWKWGLRHLVKFESLLGEVVSADDEFGFLIELFSITPDVLPIAEGLAAGDPRRNLPWFPRHGDHLNVDAGNTGFGKTEFMYGSGPVFRMVVALGPDGAEGVNILPGGQSGMTNSPYYADQAAVWLANDTWPMHTTLEAVMADATGRETFTAP